MTTSNSELQIFHNAMSDNTPRAWSRAAAAIVRSVATQETESGVFTGDIEERVAFSQESVAAIIAQPDEPIVFSYVNQPSDSDRYHRFGVTLIDPKKPFELIMKSGADGTDRLFELAIYPRRLDDSPRPMIAAREVAYTETGPHSPWMGAGVSYELRSPDAFYTVAEMIDKKAAFGNAEIAELFSSLRSETDTRANNKLFGALFEVALLAEDFDVPVLQAASFKEECAQALAKVIKASDFSTSIVSRNVQFARSSHSLLDEFTEYRGRLQSAQAQPDFESAATANVLQRIGDSRSWPYMDVTDYDQEVGHLRAFSREIDRERAEHTRRLGIFRKYADILSAISPSINK